MKLSKIFSQYFKFMTNIKDFLKKLGLSNKEVEIYLTGLKSGPVKASLLSRKTGITRQHTYDILKTLEARGFVSKSGTGYGQQFIMQDPKNLKGLLDKEKRKIEKLNLTLDKLMPEFESFFAHNGMVPKIKFYEEIDGIKEMLEDTLNVKNKEQLYVGALADLIEVIGKEYLDNWVDRRITKGVFSKTVRIKSKEIVEETYSGEAKYLREIRFAPEDFKISQTIVMYDNKVGIISSKQECYGFIIESEEFNNSIKMFFNLLWIASSKTPA